MNVCRSTYLSSSSCKRLAQTRVVRINALQDSIVRSAIMESQEACRGAPQGHIMCSFQLHAVPGIQRMANTAFCTILWSGIVETFMHINFTENILAVFLGMFVLILICIFAAPFLRIFASAMPCWNAYTLLKPTTSQHLQLWAPTSRDGAAECWWNFWWA